MIELAGLYVNYLEKTPAWHASLHKLRLNIGAFEEMKTQRKDLKKNFENQSLFPQIQETVSLYNGEEKNKTVLLLIQAIIFAGLYPNFLRARLQTNVRENATMDGFVFQSNDGEEGLRFGNSSGVNPAKVLTDKNNDRYYTYAEKMKTTSLFVSGLTSVPPGSILIFSNKVRFYLTQRVEVILPSGKIDWSFRVKPRVSCIVYCLRSLLDAMLHRYFLMEDSRNEQNVVLFCKKVVAFIHDFLTCCNF